MQGVVINPVVAIDAELTVDGNRETLREELQSRIVTFVESDGRFREVKAGIEESGYVDDYERHGITFHMVVEEDGMKLNTAASSQRFLDGALLDEGYMTQDEFDHHTTALRELAHEVADGIDAKELLGL